MTYTNFLGKKTVKNIFLSKKHNIFLSFFIKIRVISIFFVTLQVEWD